MSDTLNVLNSNPSTLGNGSGMGYLGSGTGNTYVNPLNKLTQSYLNLKPSFGQESATDNLANGQLNPYDTSFWGSKAFTNGLSMGKLGLDTFGALTSYFNGKKYLGMIQDQMDWEKSKFNESYNNVLKQWNAKQADIIRQRAGFETGNSHAYDDEIAANSMQRGQTGSAGSDYLNYKRSANA